MVLCFKTLYIAYKTHRHLDALCTAPIVSRADWTLRSASDVRRIREILALFLKQSRALLQLIQISQSIESSIYIGILASHGYRSKHKNPVGFQLQGAENCSCKAIDVYRLWQRFAVDLTPSLSRWLLPSACSGVWLSSLTSTSDFLPKTPI